MRGVVVIPTYNEKENIRPLLESLEDEFSGIPRHRFSILVVDGNSADGTREEVKLAKKAHPNIYLLCEKKKEGLGAAYLKGFRYALDRLGADVVFEMDADFSHDAADLKRLWAQIETGHDFVIGSRYVWGGKISADWSFFRRLLSLLGNLLIRLVGGLYHIHDATAGFRAIRGDLLRRLDLSGLEVYSYAFQMRLLAKAVLAGAKVKEIPVVFRQRRFGESKVGRADFFDSLKNVFFLRYEKNETFLKFALIGLTGTGVDFLALYLWVEKAGIYYLLAKALASETAIISNFIGNHLFTFRRRVNSRSTLKKLFLFNLVSIGGLLLSTFTLYLSVAFLGLHYLLGNLLAIPTAMLWNYYVNSHWTWKDE